MIKHLTVSFAFFTLPMHAFSAESLAAPGEKLSPLAFLTAHEWEAKLPDSPDGKKLSIRAHFAWGENHQAIIFHSAFVTDGKLKPYVDGIYVWNPEKHAIAMIYSDGEGTLTDGTVQVKEGKLVHEFRQIHLDGKVDVYASQLTPQGTEKWTNEIFAHKGDQLTKMVELQYVAVQ
jgi:hypothetical protein